MLGQAAAGELDVADRLSGIPSDMAALLERALSVEPHLRCNAAEFALDLRHSGEPTPVELSAGRVRAAPAEFVSERQAEPGPATVSRPTFPRPGIDAPLSHPGQLTHGVRAALRPVLPTRRRGVRDVLRGVVRYAAPVLVVLGIGTAAVVLSAHRGDAVPPVKPPLRLASPSPSGPSKLDAGAVLSSLDKLREQAFARRDPALLSRVYLPGPLLVQDTALLERIVPRGCTLVGVHTAYLSVRVDVARGRPVVTTRAMLAPSTLTCGGTRAGTAAGEGPTTLRIELVRRDDGYRIASQQTPT